MACWMPGDVGPHPGGRVALGRRSGHRRRRQAEAAGHRHGRDHAAHERHTYLPRDHGCPARHTCSHDDGINVEDVVVEAIAAAATRYLEKYSRPAELLESVVDVSEGRLQLPEEAMKRVLTMFRDERMRLSHRPLNPLTDLERETLIRGQFAFPEEPLGPVGFLALGLLSLTGKAQSVDSGLALCSRFRQGQDRRLRERTPVECAINGWSCD